MSWRVEVQRPAEKELQRISSQAQKRLIAALRKLEQNPFPPSSRRLIARHGYRMRVGEYRILYIVDTDESLIRVSGIGHRKDVYR